MSFQKLIAIVLCAFVALSATAQQQTEPNPEKPSGYFFRRPYTPVTVPPVRLGNSGRLAQLIRGGILYLTADDAIALALENNVDIESNRYDSAGWRLNRAEAGGALPGVPTASSLTSSVASGQGVLGSQAAAGVRISGASGTNPAGSNVTVQQVGTVAQTYDPTVQMSTTFSHKTLPQPNAVTSITSILIQNQRIYTGSYQQGFETGGSVNISYNEHYLNENAPTDILNPSVAPVASITIQHNLLQGLGIAVNTKDIRVARANIHISDLNFRTLVERIVGNVLGSYYTLAADYQDLEAKRDAVETAQKFLAETRRRVDLGAAAQLDVVTAQNEAAQAEQARVNSNTAILQAEVQLKSLISRTGAGDPLIADVHIVPLDRLTPPDTSEPPALKDLVATAFRNRSDLQAARENVEVTKISNVATENGLLPSAIAIATKTNQGTAGTPRMTPGRPADPYFIGGMGTALGQIFRNNFPSRSIAAGIQLQVFDRVAQADYALDVLSLRQQELGVAKSANQAQVDIANSLVALSQARARYEAAVQNRILQQQLFDAEQKKYAAGESTTYNVTQQERDLSAGRASELLSLANWHEARINLDQNTGSILEAHHVSFAEAESGKVARPSELPGTLPQRP
ncbi:MAG TPA: TolC family protein [Bryobacteraceae bacterium]|nr:TolC family protein [Bryobacteraceae bacterium]